MFNFNVFYFLVDQCRVFDEISFFFLFKNNIQYNTMWKNVNDL